MIKIPSIDAMIRREQRLKKGSMHLCHYPNGSLATFVRNIGGFWMVFDTCYNGYSSRIAQKFAKSKNSW